MTVCAVKHGSCCSAIVKVNGRISRETGEQSKRENAVEFEVNHKEEREEKEKSQNRHGKKAKEAIPSYRHVQGPSEASDECRLHTET